MKHEATLKCDKCDWSLKAEFKSIPDWHNKQCPECQDSVIVNDQDIGVYRLTEAALKLGLAVGPKSKKAGTLVRIDTSHLRK